MNKSRRSFLFTVYQKYRQFSLGSKILIFMGIGVLAGILFGEKSQIVQPLGDLFIRLLTMAAIPLVFFSLLAGLTSLVDLCRLGRISGKILVYYLFTTMMALILGLAVMNLLKPGRGIQLKGEAPDNLGEIPRVEEVFLDLVPDNIFQAFSSGKIIQVVVFAVFLGIAAMFLPPKQRQPVKKIFDLMAKLFRELVNLLMHFGPIGIGALMASTVGQHGSGMFGPLAIFIGGIWASPLPTA